MTPTLMRMTCLNYDCRHERAQLIVPYSFDTNDMKFVGYNGFTEGAQFYRYLRDSFEMLHQEGGRMMSVGLHCRIAGRPGRALAVRRFLDDLKSRSDVWIARRIDIAHHWLKNFPP